MDPAPLTGATDQEEAQQPSRFQKLIQSLLQYRRTGTFATDDQLIRIIAAATSSALSSDSADVEEDDQNGGSYHRLIHSLLMLRMAEAVPMDALLIKLIAAATPTAPSFSDPATADEEKLHNDGQCLKPLLARDVHIILVRTSTLVNGRGSLFPPARRSSIPRRMESAVLPLRFTLASMTSPALDHPRQQTTHDYSTPSTPLEGDSWPIDGLLPPAGLAGGPPPSLENRAGPARKKGVRHQGFPSHH